MSIPYPKLDGWIPLCTFKHGPIPMRIVGTIGYVSIDWKCPFCGRRRSTPKGEAGLVEDFGDSASAC